MRYSIKVVGIIVIVCILNVNVISFEFDKQKRNAVYKSDYISSAMIEVTMYLKFLNRKEMIVFRILKIYNRSPFFFCLHQAFLQLPEFHHE